MKKDILIDKEPKILFKKGQYSDSPHSFLLENKKYFVPRTYSFERPVSDFPYEYRLPLQVMQTPMVSTPWSYVSAIGEIHIHFYREPSDLTVDLTGKIGDYKFGSKDENSELSGNFWFDDSKIARLLLLKL